MGLNSVSISFAIPYDELGNIHYPFNPYGEQYESVDDALCKVGNLVHEMKEAGLAVYLSGEPHYYNPLDGEELNGSDMHENENNDDVVHDDEEEEEEEGFEMDDGDDLWGIKKKSKKKPKK